MLKALINNKYSFFWILFHVVLGLTSALSSSIFILFFYIFVFSSITQLIRIRNINSYITIFIVYIVSFEVLARMCNTSPIIPYEMGKYLLFFVLLFGILFESKRGIIGLILLLCILPAFFYDYSGLVAFKDIVFNGVGPMNIALAIIYFYKHKFTQLGFQTILRVLAYPCLSVLSFVFIRTPDFSDIEFSLSANFQTTGGFGSNQVSTILGLGMFIVFLFWVNRWRFSGYRMFDFGIMCLFAFQGLLSFSRGGMIGGAVGILVFFIVIQLSKLQYRRIKFPKVGRYVIFGGLALVISFFVANFITGGLLLLRYKGETQGTLAGVKEKNLNALTTGRLEIFKEDMALYKKYPIGGTGVGASKHLRDKSNGIVTHVELGRLISEHGLLGILYFTLLVLSGILLFFINPHPLYKSILLGFFVVALYSTFHSATRTFISPLLMGLSFIWVLQLKKKKKPKLEHNET